MIRLLLFDLFHLVAPSARSLRSAAVDDLASIPPELRSDIGMTDARLADEMHARVCSAIAARREEEARRLLEILNRIARNRGFPKLRWRSEGGS
ncbi:MAG: hypothetical protein JJU09_09820 [Rhodobacteraceae bacterium]|nr:hypothetical protein [Paracoccaceae bacterium]MCC5966642.1 hypothetical protein [Natronohydrobacter sp.]